MRSTAFLHPLATLVAALVVAGCGAEGKTGSNGTGPSFVPPTIPTVASGPLTSLGPAGIGGTDLADGSAQVFINTRDGLVTELRLGMVSEVTGTRTQGVAAERITAQSAVIGPVGGIDAAAQRFTVMSVAIQADGNTILDGLTGLAALSPGDRVEVHGYNLPAPGTILATRIARRPAGDGTVELLGNANGVNAAELRVQGVRVTSLGAATVIVVPGQPPSIAGITENARVRVVGTYDAPTNAILARQVVTGLALARPDEAEVVLDGLVQSVSRPGAFRLNDTEVTSTAAAGVTLTPGTHVRVAGRMRAGVLEANTFRVLAANERIEYFVTGVVADFQSSTSFTVRGELIDASAANFTGGSVADLANGRRVRITALAGPGRLRATEVVFQ